MTYKTQWKHVTNANNADTTTLKQIHKKQDIKEAMKGKDMKRYKLYFNFPILDNVKQITETLFRQIPRQYKLKYGQVLEQTYIQVSKDYNDVKKHYLHLHEYIKQYPTIDNQTHTLIPEDKDPSSCWLVDNVQQTLRTIYMIQQDNKWQFTTLTQQQLQTHKNQIIDLLVKNRTLKQTKITQNDTLPYTYHSIKPKCYKYDSTEKSLNINAKKKYMDA
jgi:hypothetical protein